MTIDLELAVPALAFLGPIGWQELVCCCSFPLICAAIVLTVLYFTGVIGGRKNKD